MANFECVGNPGHIESEVGRITSDKVDIDCATVFNDCVDDDPDLPDSVRIEMRGEAIDFSGAEGADYTLNTRISLRNYD